MAAVKISNKLVILSLIVIIAGATFAAGSVGLFDWRSLAGKLPVVGARFNPPQEEQAAEISPLQLENDQLKKEVSGLEAQLLRCQEEIASLTAAKAKLEKEVETLKAEKTTRDTTAEGYSRLAEVYGQMKPEQAAGIIAELDDQTAAGVLGKMKTEQTGRVLACLEPARAARLAKMMANLTEKTTARR